MQFSSNQLFILLNTHSNAKPLWLFQADLKSAQLTKADLSGAILENASLIDADLEKANLSGGDLTRARLKGANLTGAKLTDAVLRGANLNSADLSGANMNGADMVGAYGVPKAVFSINTILPDGRRWSPDTDMSVFTDPPAIDPREPLPELSQEVLNHLDERLKDLGLQVEALIEALPPSPPSTP